MNLTFPLIQRGKLKLLVAPFLSFLLISVLTVCVSAYTVSTSGVNKVYTLEYDKESLNGTLNYPYAHDPYVTISLSGATYYINGGVDTSNRVLAENYDASNDVQSRVNVLVAGRNNSFYNGTVRVSMDTEKVNFSFTNSVDITLTCTSIIGSTLTNYTSPIYIYGNNQPNITLEPSFTVLRTFDNGYKVIEVHYLYEYSDTEVNPLNISYLRTNTLIYFNLLNTDDSSYNRYRFSLYNVQITEIAEQTVQNYYQAIQAGNNDMKQFFGTINTADTVKLNNQTNVNDQLSSTVGDYTSTSNELPDFDFGEEFYIPSVDIESDVGATSDLWDLIFGSTTEGGSTPLGLFLKRVFSVITVIAVISLVITGIPNIIRFRGD